MIAMVLHTKIFLAARIGRLHNDESGVTSTEYAIMLVLVALAVVIAVPGFREGVINTFIVTGDTLDTGLNNAAVASN